MHARATVAHTLGVPSSHREAKHAHLEGECAWARRTAHSPRSHTPSPPALPRQPHHLHPPTSRSLANLHPCPPFPPPRPCAAKQSQQVRRAAEGRRVQALQVGGSGAVLPGLALVPGCLQGSGCRIRAACERQREGRGKPACLPTCALLSHPPATPPSPSPPLARCLPACLPAQHQACTHPQQHPSPPACPPACCTPPHPHPHSHARHNCHM